MRYIACGCLNSKVELLDNENTHVLHIFDVFLRDIL